MNSTDHSQLITAPVVLFSFGVAKRSSKVALDAATHTATVANPRGGAKKSKYSLEWKNTKVQFSVLLERLPLDSSEASANLSAMLDTFLEEILMSLEPLRCCLAAEETPRDPAWAASFLWSSLAIFISRNFVALSTGERNWAGSPEAGLARMEGVFSSWDAEGALDSA